MEWQAVALELAKSAPATLVLAFVAYRLDGRLQTLTERVDAALSKLVDAALREAG